MASATFDHGHRTSTTLILFWLVPWTACLLVSAAETLLLQWSWSVRDRTGPGALLTLLALVGGNIALLWLLRRLARRRGAIRWLNLAYLLGSFGALISGSLLLMLIAGLTLASLAFAASPGAVLETTELSAGLLALGLGYGCIGWGAIVGSRRIVTERVRLPLCGVGSDLAGLRIAHIADLHIGPHFPPERMRPIVDQINALEPDLIAITGDLFDFDPRFVPGGCRELARLRARHGVFAVLGNHDVYTGPDVVEAGLAEHTAIRLLRDRHEAVKIGAETLYLLGIDDTGRGLTERDQRSEALVRLARTTPADAPRILLVHRPSYLRQIAELGLPAALAGHTHGGQIALPGPAHQHNIARLTTTWTRGMFQAGDTLLYVNRGLGVTTVPLRLNCPREITIVELCTRDPHGPTLPHPAPRVV